MRRSSTSAPSRNCRARHPSRIPQRRRRFAAPEGRQDHREPRPFDFVFNVQQVRGKELTTHAESLDYLKSLGLPVSPRYHIVHDIEDAIKEIEQIGQNRSKLDFDMDGAVIKVNHFAQRDLMGSTNKFPAGPSRSSIRPKSRRRPCAASRLLWAAQAY